MVARPTGMTALALLRNCPGSTVKLPWVYPLMARATTRRGTCPNTPRARALHPLGHVPKSIWAVALTQLGTCHQGVGAGRFAGRDRRRIADGSWYSVAPAGFRGGIAMIGGITSEHGWTILNDGLELSSCGMDIANISEMIWTARGAMRMRKLPTINYQLPTTNL